MTSTLTPEVTSAWLDQLAWDIVVGEDGDDADYQLRAHLGSWTIETRYATDARELGRALLDRIDPNLHSLTVERYDSPRGFRFRVVVAS